MSLDFEELTKALKEYDRVNSLVNEVFADLSISLRDKVASDHYGRLYLFEYDLGWNITKEEIVEIVKNTSPDKYNIERDSMFGHIIEYDSITGDEIMKGDDSFWYKRRKWSDSIEQDFFSRLDNVESKYLKAECLFIQIKNLANNAICENCNKASIGLFNKWISDYRNIKFGLQKDSHTNFFIGQMYEKINNYNKAIKFFIKAARLNLKISGYLEGAGFIYWSIGQVYQKMEINKKACKYYKKGIDIMIDQNDEFPYIEEYFIFVIKHKYNDLMDDMEKKLEIVLKKLILDKVQAKYWINKINLMLAIVNKLKGNINKYLYYKNCVSLENFIDEWGFMDKKFLEFLHKYDI